MKKEYSIFLIMFAVFIYLFTLPFLFNKLPEHDEISFLVVSESINKFGLPLMYFGEESGWEYGYIHPPLYIYSISFINLFFNNLLISSRVVNILCLLFTIFFSYLITKKLFNDYKKLFYIFLFIFLVNTAVIRKSILIIFDTSLLSLLLLIFIYFFIKYQQLDNIKKYLILIFIFTLSLWTKFTTPLLLLASIGIYYLFKKKYKNLFSFIFIGISSIALFILTWYFYTSLVNGPFLTPFKSTLMERIIQNQLSLNLIFKHLSNFSYHVFWFSLPFILLLIFTILDRVNNFIKTRELSILDFFVIYIILTWGSYLVKAPNINYIFPIVPIAIILISYSINKYKILEKINKKKFFFLLSIIFIFFLYYFFLMLDPLLLLPNILPFNNNTFNILILLMLHTLPVIILVFYSIFKKNISFFFISCLVLLIPINISLDLKQTFANYSTEILYGQRGYENAVEYAKKYISKEEIILSDQDLAFLNGNKFYGTNPLTEFNICGDSTLIKGVIHPSCGFGLVSDIYNITDVVINNNITFIIYSDFPYEVKGSLTNEAKEILTKYYILEKQFGNFYIYKKKITI